MGKKENVVGFLKNDKSIIIIIILIVVGIVLMLLPANSNNTSSEAKDNGARLEAYADDLESKIADLCSKVKGVSSVSVSVYFDSGFETIYAYNEESKATSNGYNSEKKYITIGSGDNEAMVCILEKMPTICGVAIVCNGCGNPIIANELINLISAAYGVPKNKIYVTEGKK